MTTNEEVRDAEDVTPADPTAEAVEDASADATGTVEVADVAAAAPADADTDATDAAPLPAVTSDWLVQVKLPRAVRGYAPKDVDELLDRVADELDRLDGERAQADARADAADKRLAEASATEITLKRTLVTAQRAADESVAEAHSRAEAIIAEAEANAAALIETARNEAIDERASTLRRLHAEEADLRARRARLVDACDQLRTFEVRSRELLRDVFRDHLQSLDSGMVVSAVEPQLRPSHDELRGLADAGIDASAEALLTDDAMQQPAAQPVARSEEAAGATAADATDNAKEVAGSAPSVAVLEDELTLHDVADEIADAEHGTTVAGDEGHL